MNFRDVSFLGHIFMGATERHALFAEMQARLLEEAGLARPEGLRTHIRSQVSGKAPAMDLKHFYTDALALERKELLGAEFAPLSAMLMTPEWRLDHLPVAADFEDYSIHKGSIAVGPELAAPELFTYQDQALIDEIKSDGRARVSLHILDPRFIYNDTLPSIQAPFYEAVDLMLLEDYYMHGYNEDFRHVIMLREDVIGPDFDTRGGLILHTDQTLFGDDESHIGAIKRAWNVVSDLPTAGFFGAGSGKSAAEIRELLLMKQAFADDPTRLHRIMPEAIKEHEIVSFYPHANKLFAFVGGENGLHHYAQPIIEGTYIDGDGQTQHLEGDTLRRMATIFTVEVPQKQRDQAMLERINARLTPDVMTQSILGLG